MVIADLSPHGPADAAGITVGDVVLTVDGYAMSGLPEFTAALYQHPPTSAAAGSRCFAACRRCRSR